MDLRTVTKKGTKHEHVFRVGRGIGSGLGKTCGRGHKGWGQRSGAYRRPGFRTDYTVVNVEVLEAFDNGAVVDLAAVLAKGLTSLEAPLFKVLGDGALTKALTVRAQKFSKSAAEKIRAAGGRAVVLDAQGREAAEPAGDAK